MPTLTKAGPRAGATLRRTRLAGALTAGVATLSCLFAAPPAHAATPDPNPAVRAADFVAGSLVGGDHLTSQFGDESATADGLLALAAGGSHPGEVAAMTAYLQAHASAYATSPEAAAKLVLVAAAAGADPKNFGGVDLVELMADGVAADGAFGQYPGPYSSGLGLIAMRRCGDPAPDSMTTWLVGQQQPDGGWGFDPTAPSDTDSTGMALLGLAALPAPDAATTAAIDAAKAWVQANQQADGSWAGAAPVNSTAVLAMAQLATGLDATKAVAWLASTQLTDGGLPTQAGGTAADPLATAQAALPLAQATYLSVGANAATPGSATPGSATAPPKPPEPPDQPPAWATWGIPIALIVVIVIVIVAVQAMRRSDREGNAD